jgi:hypothetical protein
MALECAILVLLIFNLFRTEALLEMKADVQETKEILLTECVNKQD